MERHASLDTDALMGIANEMAGFAETPPDSAVYYPGHGIRKVLFGLEISAGELLYARSYGFDAVIAHQPLGLVNAWRSFGAHEEQLERAGVPRAAARAAVSPRREALAVRGHAENFDRLTSLARLLDIPLLNIHQALDELGRRILQQTVDAALSANPDTTLAQLGATFDLLPEFQVSPTQTCVALGNPENRAGRTVVSHGAYLNGGHEIISAYYAHGIDTVTAIDVEPEDLVSLRAAGVGQLLITGRVSGIAVGINPYIARLEEIGIEVVRLSGAIAG